VRAPGDYALGHIQGAENVPLGDIGSWQPPASKNVVLYCPGSLCEASSAASKALSERGYSNVQVLDGGLAAWQKAGYPVARKEVLPAVQRPSVGRLSAQQAKTAIKAGTLFILDARPAAEFSAGHLPGAVNIPLEELGTALARVPTGRQVLVYDRLSSRSREAAEMLVSAGYGAKELTGGVAGWVKAKYALEVK